MNAARPIPATGAPTVEGFDPLSTATILLQPSGMHEQTLLIVDDVPSNLALLHDLLRPHYRIQAATNGPRALQLATADPVPDLILLDIMMPQMDGLEVMAHLRANPRTRGIPVIFVTAMESPQDEEQGLDLGAVDYITKPLRPTVALARIRTQLELRRARDVLANHNAALEAEVARRMAENERIQDVTIHALARLAEKRDPETGNHLRRTTEYVRALATALRASGRHTTRLTDRAIAAMAKSAPLHDIGKVAIPDQILHKPGPLTAAEWQIMRTHAAHGRHAIEQAEQDANQPVEFLEFAKQITQCHHERWDGSGYPDGLVGESIPLAARLMAVADVFDALISKRVYKEAFPAERARAEIVAASGSHFDPAVVEAFERVFDEFLSIAARFRDSP
jgi:putative two-component system response regulator